MPRESTRRTKWLGASDSARVADGGQASAPRTAAQKASDPGIWDTFSPKIPQREDCGYGPARQHTSQIMSWCLEPHANIWAGVRERAALAGLQGAQDLTHLLSNLANTAPFY
eukprot:2101382-Rhodomonas_salina.1